MSAGAADTLRFEQIDSITAYRIDVKGNSFVSDRTGNLYKFDVNGKEITRVNSKVHGAIYSIDCSNPFELYVYHKEQNVIVFYDNMLNTRSILRLNDHGFTNVQAIARSFDNGIWLFDNTGYELKKINKEGKELLSSGNITAFVHLDIDPYAIIEDGQKVYVADQSNGLLIFDLFGTYLSHLSIAPALQVDVSKGQVYIMQEGQVIHWDPKSLEQTSIPLPNQSASIAAHRGQLFAIHADFIVRIL